MKNYNAQFTGDKLSSVQKLESEVEEITDLTAMLGDNDQINIVMAAAGSLSVSGKKPILKRSGSGNGLSGPVREMQLESAATKLKRCCFYLVIVLVIYLISAYFCGAFFTKCLNKKKS